MVSISHKRKEEKTFVPHLVVSNSHLGSGQVTRLTIRLANLYPLVNQVGSSPATLGGLGGCPPTPPIGYQAASARSLVSCPDPRKRD